jgi:chromosome segregation ATPase
MELAERERQFSRVLVDGNIDEKVIAEFISSARSLGEAQSQLRNAESELAEARQKIANLERQREQQAQVEEDLQARLSKQTARLSSLSQSHSSSSPGASRQLAVLKLENSKLKQECADQEAKNAELTVQLCELQSKLDDCEHDGIRVDAGTARLRTQLQEAHANLYRSQSSRTGDSSRKLII